MILDIEIFVWLNDFVEAQNIKKKDWARASDMPAARISDLCRLAKMTRKGQEARDDLQRKHEVGRAFTLDKCVALIRGIINLMGKDGVEKLLSTLPNIKNPQHRNHIMMICLEEEQEQLRLFMETLLKAKFPGIKLGKK